MKLICSKRGCPRTRNVDRQEYEPPMAEVMQISCPWHEKPGEFEEPTYYTKDGKEIIQTGDNEYELV